MEPKTFWLVALLAITGNAESNHPLKLAKGSEILEERQVGASGGSITPKGYRLHYAAPYGTVKFDPPKQVDECHLVVSWHLETATEQPFEVGAYVPVYWYEFTQRPVTVRFSSKEGNTDKVLFKWPQKKTLKIQSQISPMRTRNQKREREVNMPCIKGDEWVGISKTFAERKVLQQKILHNALEMFYVVVLSKN